MKWGFNKKLGTFEPIKEEKKFIVKHLQKTIQDGVLKHYFYISNGINKYEINISQNKGYLLLSDAKGFMPSQINDLIRLIMVYNINEKNAINKFKRTAGIENELKDVLIKIIKGFKLSKLKKIRKQKENLLKNTLLSNEELKEKILKNKNTKLYIQIEDRIFIVKVDYELTNKEKEKINNLLKFLIVPKFFHLSPKIENMTYKYYNKIIEEIDNKLLKVRRIDMINLDYDKKEAYLYNIYLRSEALELKLHLDKKFATPLIQKNLKEDIDFSNFFYEYLQNFLYEKQNLKSKNIEEISIQL